MDGDARHLFVDEAGQVSLADALALGTAARNMVLLGDPQQLAQVVAGHPPRGRRRVGARAPARRRATVPPTAACSSIRPGACTPTSARSSPSWSTTAASSRAAAARGRRSAPGRRSRHRPALAPGRARGQPQLSIEEADGDRRGGRRAARRRATRPRRPARAARRRTTSWSSRPTTPRYAACATRCPTAPGRHGRQVPGPGGAGRLLLDGDLERRRHPAQPRVPLQPQPPQRRDLARAVRWRSGRAARGCSRPCRTIEQMRLVNALCRVAEIGGA